MPENISLPKENHPLKGWFLYAIMYSSPTLFALAGNVSGVIYLTVNILPKPPRASSLGSLSLPKENHPLKGWFLLVGLSGLEPPTPTLSGKVFLKCGGNTYYLLPLIYNNFSTTKFLLQQNKSNLLLQFVANVLIYDIFFALILPKTN